MTQAELNLWPERVPVLLTVQEAADVLRLGRSTIYLLIAAGQLEVVHIGRSARVPLAAINEFVDRLREQQPK